MGCPVVELLSHICLVLSTLTPLSQLQDGAENPIPSSKITPTFKGEPEPYRSVTNHQLRIGDQEISYDAIAGETYLKDSAGNAIGSIFSFTYLRTDVENRDRPVLFIFNGGPGSASLWLHMGALGPKKTRIG